MNVINPLCPVDGRYLSSASTGEPIWVSHNMHTIMSFCSGQFLTKVCGTRLKGDMWAPSLHFMLRRSMGLLRAMLLLKNMGWTRSFPTRRLARLAYHCSPNSLPVGVLAVVPSSRDLPKFVVRGCRGAAGEWCSTPASSSDSQPQDRQPVISAKGSQQGP